YSSFGGVGFYNSFVGFSPYRSFGYPYGGFTTFAPVLPLAPGPVVMTPARKPTYIQQRSYTRSAPAPRTNYWHYCRNPEGYYPYVKKCPGGWLKVLPQPAS
ncbi:MAG TPA: hypothetical protein PLK61_11190, partial [Nitrosomonas sp.]|nr:hypothetical protein [Nitrosomonas sp.]